ncbi:MAG: class I fructose-bisphosphate aldolase family protein [Firmicutes bacterium]|nr:class I fructose-bisphosphate aldolase family protein [Bacillota bacterium]
MTGKQLRLKRLFKHSGRVLIVPMDHGVSLGPVPGLQDILTTVKQVIAGGADAILVHKGQARYLDELGEEDCELIVHLSASTDLAPDPNTKELVSTPEHGVRLGATAISVHVNLGSANEASMLTDLGRVAEACDAWGIPLLAMMYVRDGTKASEYEPTKIAHGARVAEELGADIVKVNYTGSPESFAQVVRAVRIPVVIAGGPKMGTAEDILDSIKGALQAGAVGVAVGRNLFQADQPEMLARQIRNLLDQHKADKCL